MSKVALQVPLDAAQAIVTYLQKRPYEEVYGLIGVLMQAPRTETEAATEKPASDG